MMSARNPRARHSIRSTRPCGYAPYVVDGANQRRANLFLAVVGGTATGKGSSFAFVDWLLTGLDENYRIDRIITAVGSGEGLLSKITDPVYTLSPRGEEILALTGSADKRVLYVEEELGALFNKMVTQESVEKMITKAWDSGVLETATKKESMRCTRPHVSIIGHITPDELYDRLDKRLLDNGFSNRWLYVRCMCSSRRQPSSSDPCTPPRSTAPTTLSSRSARTSPKPPRASPAPWTSPRDAEDLFAQTHHAMTGYRFAGAMGKQSARWAPQVYKLAIVYAAVDGAAHIDAPHLAAARSAWAYNYRSAAAFFAGMTGNQHADQLLQMWRDADYTDLTLTDIDEMFSKHMSAHRRGKMLDRVVRDGLISKTSVQRPGAGRPSTGISFNGLTGDKAPAAAW